MLLFRLGRVFRSSLDDCDRNSLADLLTERPKAKFKILIWLTDTSLTDTKYFMSLMSLRLHSISKILWAIDGILWSTNEPAHDIMALFVLRKLILQTRMRSHPVGLGAWFLVGSFVYFHTLCMRSAKALARLRECAGSPEPSLVAYVISTIISWAGSKYLTTRQIYELLLKTYFILWKHC